MLPYMEANCDQDVLFCSAQEAVYWDTVTLKDVNLHLTTPSNVICCYEVQVQGVDTVTTFSGTGHNPYLVGDHV